MSSVTRITLLVTVIILAKAACLPAYGQELPLSLYRMHTGSGLPHNTVYDIHFDEEGWLWVATAVGLFRHDGVGFVPYRSSVARHHEMHNLQRGADGRIYVQNFRRQIFRVSGDSLALVVDLGMVGRDYVSYSAMDAGLGVMADGELLFGAFDELPDLGRVATPNLPGAFAIIPNTRGSALVSERRNRPYYHFDGRTVREAPRDDDGVVRLQCTTARGDFLLRDKGDSLTWQSVSDATYATLWTSPNPIPGQILRTCLSRPDGSLLFGGDRGLLCYGIGGDWRTLLSQADVSALAEDRAGRVWVATLDRGVFALPHRDVTSTEYASLPSPLVRLGVLPNGERYGTTRGGHLYALRDSAYLLHGPAKESSLWLTAAGDSLRLGRRLGIGPGGGLRQLPAASIDGRNLMKAAVELTPGVEAYAGISGVFVHLPPGGPEVLASGYWEDSSRTLLNLRQVRSHDIDYDAARHRLWVASLDSLMVFDAGGRYAMTSPALETTPTTVDVFGDGHVLVGTSGGGLLYGAIDSLRADQPFAKVSSATGSQVQAVAVDGGVAWVVTEAGLHRCQRGVGAVEALQCVGLGVAYGLPPQAPSALVTAPGRVIPPTITWSSNSRAIPMPPTRLGSRRPISSASKSPGKCAVTTPKWAYRSMRTPMR